MSSYFNGIKYDTKECKIEIYENKKLKKIDFRIFGVGYTTPEEEIKTWLSNQLSFLKLIEGFLNPVIKVYENNTLIAENKLS